MGKLVRTIGGLVIASGLAANLGTIVHAQAPVAVIATLLDRARAWFARDRFDMAREALDRLFRVDPDNADGLAMLAEIEVRSEQPERAASTLARLRAEGPGHPAIARIETMLRLEGPDRDKLRDARLLARSGQTKAAIAAFRALYPSGPPGGDLALEYWQLIGDTADGWEESRAGLARLVKEQPENLRYRFALAEHEASRRPINLAALQTVIEMARLPQYARQAQAAWRRAVMRLDDTPANIPWLQAYVRQAPGDTGARDRLAAMTQAVEDQRRLLADPAYQIGREGLALLEKGDLARAEESLERSLKRRPNDAGVVGGMGLLRLRQGRHAEAQAFFERAIKLDTDNASKWSSLARTARFWGVLRGSEEALTAGDPALAERRAHDALSLDARSADARVALGRAQQAAGRTTEAERSWHGALRLDPTHGGALRALLSVAVEAGTADAVDRVEARLTAAQRAVIAEEIAAARTRFMRQEADRLATSGRDAEAISLLEAAIKIGRQDPWCHYDLARLYQRTGATARGMALLDALVSRSAGNAEAVYASALFRMNAGDPVGALSLLDKVPENERTGNMLLAEGRLLRSSGRNQEAIARYRQVLALYPENTSAILALIDLLVATNQLAEARQRIDRSLQAGPLQGTDDLDTQVALAAALDDLRDVDAARRQLELVLAIAPAHVDALETMARIERRAGRIDIAIAQVRQALAANHAQRELTRSMQPISRIQPTVEGVANATLRSQSNAVDGLAVEPASSASVIAESNVGGPYRMLATMLDERASWLSGGLDWRFRKGTSGTSRLDDRELPLEWKRPIGAAGRMYFRTDLVSVDAGAIDLASSGDASEFGSVLLCQPPCSTGRFLQRDSGVSLTAGYELPRLRVDLGVTPIGFAVVRPVGGLIHRGELGDFSYSLDLSSRTVTSSLLSYAGARDPRTGVIWGGVQASGARLTVSRDEGGAFGAWASVGLHRLTGRNVLANDRFQAMTGMYWRIINASDRLLSVGVTAMTWRYSENAGEFTFGHGGYFSPQSYRSISLPINFGERSARFSYAVRAAVNASRTVMEEAPFFPTDAALQAEAQARAPTTGVNPVYEGSRSGGGGFTLALGTEYQMAPQLFLGSRLEIERSRNFEPNRALLYLRYSLDRVAARPVPLPPEPFLPTVEH